MAEKLEPPRRDGAAAAPRDRAQARPPRTPTTRSATRSPSASVRLPEARELIQKALELSPGEPFITDSLGWVEYRMGNRDEALRLLRRPTRRGPTRRSPRTSARCCGSTGQPDEARKVWREGALARRGERRAAGDAGAAAGRPVSGAASRRGGLRCRCASAAPSAAAVAGCAHARRRRRAAGGDACRAGSRCGSSRSAQRRRARWPRLRPARRRRSAGTLGLSTPLGSMLAAGALGAGRRSCWRRRSGDAPLRRPRRADARGARRERAGRGAVRLAARPAVARRAEHAAPADGRASSSSAGRVDLARFGDGAVAATRDRRRRSTVRIQLDRPDA